MPCEPVITQIPHRQHPNWSSLEKEEKREGEVRESNLVILLSLDHSLVIQNSDVYSEFLESSFLILNIPLCVEKQWAL